MSATDNPFTAPQEPKMQESGSALSPKFDANGLLTAIVQDRKSGEILMLAHMNAAALSKTIETGESYFWSRSRQELWHKGATSGNIQKVREIRLDCDQDAVVLLVEVQGKASCHTGARTCFYRRITNVDGLPALELVDDNVKNPNASD